MPALIGRLPARRYRPDPSAFVDRRSGVVAGCRCASNEFILFV
jgi:hypothetical protein